MRMRYILSFLLAAVTLSTQAATTIDAGGITYNIQSQASATLAVAPSSAGAYSGNVTIPATVNYDGKTWTVTRVDRHAFADCPELTKVTLPSTVTTIMDYIFENTPDLVTVEMPGVTMIYDMAFYNSGIRTIILPETLQRMRNAVFADCRNLVSVKIPASLTDMGNNAPFSGCTSLTSIEVAEGNAYFTSINGLLFTKDGATLIDCPAGLATAVIPHGTQTLRMGAFKGNTKMKSLTLPATLSVIERYVFDGCDAMTDILIEGNNPVFQSIGGILYSGTRLAICPRGRTSVDVIDGTTELSTYSFGYCTKLARVSLPPSLTTIADHVFESCTSLTHIDLPESLTAIDIQAFYRCDALESIVIPDKVETIASSTFHLCSSLKRVTLGQSLKTIKPGAFAYCPAIVEINVRSAVPPEVEESFLGFVAEGVYRAATLNVPAGCRDIYAATSPWSRFADIREAGSSGADEVAADPCPDDIPMYDLYGRRISAPAKGQLYIQAGQKHIAK